MLARFHQTFEQNRSLFRYLLKSSPIVLVSFLWLIAFDGPVWSDDVFYLNYGWQWWSNHEINDDIHFVQRWGAYLLPGLQAYLFQPNFHWPSFPVLLSFIGSYLLLAKYFNTSLKSYWFGLLMFTQVYLIHFLTKIFPDGLLIFWVIAVPVVLTFRIDYPKISALLLIFIFWVGFSTKETMVYLFPLPFLVFWNRRKTGKEVQFFTSFLTIGLLGIMFYLSYFYWKYGSPLFRIENILANYYESPYSYYDKGLIAIVNRLTFEFIEFLVTRTFWLYVVFPLVILFSRPFKNYDPFDWAFLLILGGFWLGSTHISFYNPMPLNPRHLIILVPLASFIVVRDYPIIFQKKIRVILSICLTIAVSICLLNEDYLLSLFYILCALCFLSFDRLIGKLGFTILLIGGLAVSILQQKQLKQYPLLIQSFKLESTISKGPIYTHSYLFRAKNIEFVENELLINIIHEIDGFDPLQVIGDELRVIIHDYYQHAYPDEGDAWDDMKIKLSAHDFQLVDQKKVNGVSRLVFKKNAKSLQ